MGGGVRATQGRTCGTSPGRRAARPPSSCMIPTAAPDPDGRPQLSGAGVQPDRAGAYRAELHRENLSQAKETVLQSDAEPSLFTLCYLQIDHAAHLGKGGRHRAQMDLIGIPAHHKLHRLSGGKGEAIAQLKRLPVLRDAQKQWSIAPRPAARFSVKAEASAAFSP